MMLQMGDEEIMNASVQGYMCPYQTAAHCHQQETTSLQEIVTNLMSIEDFLSSQHHGQQGESTLPPVETVLPQHQYDFIATITPPPSIPSPSIQMNPHPTKFATNTTQHQTPQLQQPTLTQQQHNHNIIAGNTNITSTAYDCQLFNVDYRLNNINHTDVRGDSAQNVTNTSLEEAQPVYVSDASTVDIDENEQLTDEPFTYLQNLNSGNLMKFSQQSEIMNLMEQIVETKRNCNSIPVCEEHDNGGYDFGIQVNTTDKASRYVFFSQDTQRLYVKPHEHVTIDCLYKIKMPIQPLNVRIMPIYTTGASEPVRRCQNHISKDNETNEIIRNSLLRCENLGAVYYGSDTGKSIRDRYSVVVPLNAAVKVGDAGNHLKQQLIIHFTCNNSCMSRKPTSVLFLLENMSGEILAQRMIAVKISTCPKRDYRLYERPTGKKRRPIGDPDFASTTDAKMARYDDTCIKDEYSRSSYGDPSDDEANASSVANGDCTESNVDVVLDPTKGEYTLTLKYKTRHQMLEVLRLLYSNAVTNEVFYKTSINGRKTRDTEHLKKCYEKTLRLKLE